MSLPGFQVIKRRVHIVKELWPRLTGIQIDSTRKKRIEAYLKKMFLPTLISVTA